ncbi:MAG: hypothetical protein ING59_14520 [Burkholderiales bacterium]|jgi:hypothetical protein|nr:hypothetical protein [Burkholderiales bacterium]
MQRRRLLAAALVVAAVPAAAHHGWSSFDQNAPLYLQGQLTSVRWTNPHAEGVLEVSKGLTLPADLAKRTLPPQQQAVDAQAILARLQVPQAAEGKWELEFAPLPRMDAWGVAPLKAGDRIEVIGYVGVPGKPKVMRVEYLIVNGTAYGLRSSPR